MSPVPSSGLRPVALMVSLLLAACGGGKPDTPAPPAAAAPSASGLTAFQEQHGIGPVTEEIVLGPVDEELAEDGKELFEAKCAACHKMEEKYVGPPLGDATTKRSPAYLMNMILNPDGMYTKHPSARALLAEYMTQMPNLGLTQEQARQVVEYLRTQAPK